MVLSEDITKYLNQWAAGDEEALRRLLPLVYQELRRLANGYLSREREDHTLGATALVHETYLRVRQLDRMEWKNRAHFIGVVAGLMRRILVDHARERNAQKRGRAVEPSTKFDVERMAREPDPDLWCLNEALERFAVDYPRQAQVVELKFFGGLTTEEISEVLGHAITTRTVERDWRFARAWLQRAMTSPS